MVSTEAPGRKPGSRIWCPKNLDVDGLLEGFDERVAEAVLWLGHCVLVQLANDARCRDDRGEVPLKTEFLRKVIGRHHLDKVRDLAERNGYVERNRSYLAGNRSKTYRLLEPYDSARLVRREVKHPILRRNIRDFWEDGHRRMWGRIRRNETPVDRDVCEHLWSQVQRIRIDEDADYGESFHPAHQIAVDQIHRGAFRFKVDDYGRIHTNVTNMAKVLRRHLSVDGQRLVNADIGESQPLFIGQAIASARGRTTGGNDGDHYSTSLMLDKPTSAGWQFNRVGLPRDMEEYLALCEAGSFYQTLADLLGVSRDDAKSSVMKAFFGKPYHQTAASRVIEQRFPSVLREMREVKRSDYRHLAHCAQRIESAFVYGRVVPRIIREQPKLFITTIHDSVLTTEHDGPYVQQLMMREFARLGISPKVKLESC